MTGETMYGAHGLEGVPREGRSTPSPADVYARINADASVSTSPRIDVISSNSA